MVVAAKDCVAQWQDTPKYFIQVNEEMIYLGQV
jgi:hypothetical protein